MVIQGEQKLRLLLHAGTTKTGSSTMQVFLDRHRSSLAEQGILYPNVGLENASVYPKHQWIVNSLLCNDEKSFLVNLALVIEKAKSHKKIHTVLLSTEGLYNHWWDFSDQAKALLRQFQDSFDITVWIVFRHPVHFVRSLYGQVIINEKSKLVGCYGTSEPLENVINDAWFLKQLIYGDFIQDIEAIFGSSIVLATRYEDDDIISQLSKILGIPIKESKLIKNENISHGDISIELIRRLNKAGVDSIAREKFIEKIRELDSVIRINNENLLINKGIIDRVKFLSRQSREYLYRRYKISWEL